MPGNCQIRTELGRLMAPDWIISDGFLFSQSRFCGQVAQALAKNYVRPCAIVNVVIRSVRFCIPHKLEDILTTPIQQRMLRILDET